MPGKGLRNLLSSYSFGHHRHHHRPPTSYPRPQQEQTLSDLMIKEQLASAEAIVPKWDPEASAYAKITSLFQDGRAEAHEFLVAVRGLQHAMLKISSAEEMAAAGSHAALVRGQTLMQAAMRRLEKEFYQILAANRDRLDPESVSGRSSNRSSVSENAEDDEISAAGDFIGEVESAAASVMADLRAIAETMMTVGYGKECVGVYKILRKSIVDEGLYRLGFERLTSSQVRKMDWQLLERKIQCWIGASRVATTTLFSGERILLDHVFCGFDSIREVVIADIAGDAAVQLLRFPELVVKSKLSTEKMFWILDMYDAISELLPEIDAVFSFASTAAVREQAVASLSKLAEAARTTFADFEAAVQKEHSKSMPPGGGIHPLTSHAMDYIAKLAGYESTLAEIFAEVPLQKQSLHLGFLFDKLHSEASSLASSSSCSSLSSSNDGCRSAIGVRLAWLILVLLCKLDSKAESYHHAGLSYLFLANNVQHIVNKVQSCRLRMMLGDEWAARQASKVSQYVGGFERVAWGKVAAAVPATGVTPAEARERMRAFKSALEGACDAQAKWVVADETMREEVKGAVRGMVLPVYKGFYERWRAALEEDEAVTLSPDDAQERLAVLFSGWDGSESSSFSSYRFGSESGSIRSLTSSS